MSPSAPDLIQVEWSAPAHIGACVTTREGGFGQPPFAGLNLGLDGGDQAEVVQQNRRLVTRTLNLQQPPSWLHQVHGTRVLRLPVDDTEPEADAAWTDQPGVCCVVLTADCLPVLLTDIEGTLVAAVHAGWRGLAAGVIGACITQLPVPAERLLAWLGPAISAAHYEVDEPVFTACTRNHPEAASCFAASRKNHWHADLPGLARQQLRRLGVLDISGGNCCTATDARRFFSYRRDGKTGRMASLIWIKKASNSAA